MMLKLLNLQAIRAEHKRLESCLSEFGRKIYHIRFGEELPNGYQMTSWHASISDGTRFDAEDDNSVSYPEGTPILDIHFYHGRWEVEKSIRVPQSYLDGSAEYLDLERLAVQDRERQIAETTRAKTERNEIEEKARRKRLYEQLRAEFEVEGD